jgi:uncharacterized protein with von Willebrand factor type A (vWA) domain
MSETERALSPFLSFAALLRRAGFLVAPEQTMAWLGAIELLGPRGIDDIRRAARATLAPPPERFEEFDALFDAHFLGLFGMQAERAPGDEEAPRAVDEDPGGPEPIFGEDSLQSGARAASAEKLAERRFAPGDEAEILRRFSRALPARLPKRRGYRWRAAHPGVRLDARRMFREAMRHAGELVRLRWRSRRPRQRRIVLLVDVSGSMKERTRSHLSFAHALTRGADAAEVFTIGTRLTRITRALRMKERQRALAAASQLVADWDGGTRIGEALAAFLAIPRFSALARGAAVIVLSDGLERGDPGAMREAVARLSQLAWRLIWLTPLAADPEFELRTAGLNAARPFIDEIGDGASIESLCARVLGIATTRAA